MVGVVVRVHKVLKDVDESPRLVFREVSPHTRLQRSIEVVDAVLLQQSLNGERTDSEIRVLDLSATSLASLR